MSERTATANVNIVYQTPDVCTTCRQGRSSWILHSLFTHIRKDGDAVNMVNSEILDYNFILAWVKAFYK